MSKVFSVIPNICEGKDEKFIALLTEKLKQVKRLILLNVSMDKTRNRTIFSFTGTKEAIFEGGAILYVEAQKHIDMRRHKGEYPRIGAVDVFPFVPLVSATIEEAVELATEFAEKIAGMFKIPVYLFGESAKLPLRHDIEKIREGEYEGLAARLKDPRWKPDFGSDEFKPDFGATIIGARYPLVSFIMKLDTSDLEITRKICRSIQYSSGGLRNVTAYSGIVHETKQTQITVSISNYKITPIYKVIEMTRMEAKRYGIQIVETEMIGLIPEIVFLESAMYYMNINGFSYENLIEKNIQRHLNEKVLFVN